jgi:hypothetical protein
LLLSKNLQITEKTNRSSLSYAPINAGPTRSNAPNFFVKHPYLIQREQTMGQIVRFAGKSPFSQAPTGKAIVGSLLPSNAIPRGGQHFRTST